MYERRVVFKDNCRRFFFSAAADPSERRSSGARTREARAAQKRLYTKEDINSQKDRQQTFSKEKKLEAFERKKKHFVSLQLINLKDKYGKNTAI